MLVKFGKLSTILIVFTLVLVSIVSMYLKFQISEQRKEVGAMRQQILQEQESLHVLKAEWSYLNHPERLQKLARKFLRFDVTKSSRIITYSEIPKCEEA